MLEGQPRVDLLVLNYSPGSVQTAINVNPEEPRIVGRYFTESLFVCHLHLFARDGHTSWEL